MEDMSHLLSPHQLGFGVRGGIEAAIHAACCFINQLSPGEAFVKLDFCNAFNSLRRDKMLHSVKSLCPTLNSFVFSAYSSPHLSIERTGQFLQLKGFSNPLGSLLFCLTLHQFLVQLKSPFHVGYLDNVSLGGPVESLVGDISIIKKAVNIGLVLNSEKSEVIGRVSDGVDQLTCSSVLPGAQSILPSSVCFLGSPIGDINHVSSVICEKIGFLHQLGERLCLFSVHDSILLLLNSFAIPCLIFC